MMKIDISGGVLPAMATPLTEEGSQVNVEVVAPLVEFLLGVGVKGLFVGGTTGEGILLPAGQRRRLYEATITAVSGRVPVLLHVGANTTAEAEVLAAEAATLGADGIAVVTPYFYPLGDDALLAFYQTVAAAAPETPFFAYDIPQMAVNGVSPALLTRLVESVPTLAGMKSSTPDAQKIRALTAAAPAGTIVLAGSERIALGSLALGAQGLISGLSTAIPEPFVALTSAFAKGDVTEAQRWQRVINQLLDLLPAGYRMGAIKAILAQRGFCVGPPIPPRPVLDDPTLWTRMEALLPA